MPTEASIGAPTAEQRPRAAFIGGPIDGVQQDVWSPPPENYFFEVLEGIPAEYVPPEELVVRIARLRYRLLRDEHGRRALTDDGSYVYEFRGTEFPYGDV